MTEIEIKAWVAQPDRVKERLAALASYKGAFDKADIYWQPPQTLPQTPPVVRLRSESAECAASKQTLVTYKSKERRGGMEVNCEREFVVSDAAVFENLLRLLGYRIGWSKHKSGFSYEKDGITAELSLVEGLGYFIELEIIAPDEAAGAAALIEDCRERLLRLLRLLGIEENKIEERYYTELLSALP